MATREKVLISKTSERVIPDESMASKEEYLLYLRFLFAYEFAKDKISESSSVLEMGCGAGYGANLLSQHVKEIIGLDVDQDMIAYALKKYGSENCFFKLYDGIKIPYQDNTFDAVVSLQVIEHIQDDSNYISEIHRVLKNNGIFILTTPNKTLRLKPNQRPWNRFHVREYDQHELEGVLKTKFFDVKIQGIRGNEEVQRVELGRINEGLKIISLDPLNLRKLIPQSLKPTMIKFLRKLIYGNNTKENNNFLKKYSSKDYYIIENNLEDSLDLLGICKK